MVVVVGVVVGVVVVVVTDDEFRVEVPLLLVLAILAESPRDECWEVIDMAERWALEDDGVLTKVTLSPPEPPCGEEE